MLIRCPYPDCLSQYELALPANPSLIHAICPNCQKKGTAISLEIRQMLEERAKKFLEIQSEVVKMVKENTFGVLVENMRSLWNVGSIFRTSDAAGVSFLCLCGISGYPPKKEITKTALGAEKTIPWQYFVHPLDIIPQLKKQGVTIVGLERHPDATNLSDLLKGKKIKKPLCLVIGNEVTGLSPESLYYCDYICSLPMHGIKQSLNASVAFGVAAYLINEYNN